MYIIVAEHKKAVSFVAYLSFLAWNEFCASCSGIHWNTFTGPANFPPETVHHKSSQQWSSLSKYSFSWSLVFLLKTASNYLKLRQLEVIKLSRNTNIRPRAHNSAHSELSCVTSMSGTDYTLDAGHTSQVSSKSMMYM